LFIFTEIKMDTQYAIKDLERLSGVKAHTLRIWEQRYGILKPKRSQTNIRYYSSADLKRILNISLLNNNGFKISKIATLPDDEILNQAQLILNNYNSESDQIDNLVFSMMEMDELKFEKIISNCVIHFGFENTMEKVVFPFLKQVGNMWQMGLINTVQEHFISHLIRQKLIVGIDGLFEEKLLKPKTFLLYLPNKELHELGLLYSYFLIKSKGHKCFYIGQSVPHEDLVKVNELVTPDVILTSFTNPIEDKSIQDYLKTISKTFKNKLILVSGRLIQQSNQKIDFPNNVCLLNSFEELKNMLSSANFTVNEIKHN
jgi:DNA-binding transcriptional MerR regulator